MKLDNFVDMMTGHFNNKEQFDKMKTEGKIYPYAEHINTICNGKNKTKIVWMDNILPITNFLDWLYGFIFIDV